MVSKAFVLAGGASRRFGHDKARFEVQGRPMVAHVVDVLLQAGLEPCLVVRDSALSDLGFPLLREPEADGFYPLRGMVFALETLALGESALFCPCDVPFLDLPSVQSLLLTPAPAVAFDGERVHPLIAHYAHEHRDRLHDHIQRQASALQFGESAQRVLVSPHAVRNINHPDDLDSV